MDLLRNLIAAKSVLGCRGQRQFRCVVWDPDAVRNTCGWRWTPYRGAGGSCCSTQHPFRRAWQRTDRWGVRKAELTPKHSLCRIPRRHPRRGWRQRGPPSPAWRPWPRRRPWRRGQHCRWDQCGYAATKTTTTNFHRRLFRGPTPQFECQTWLFTLQ